jgi:hypothetical protein
MDDFPRADPTANSNEQRGLRSLDFPDRGGRLSPNDQMVPEEHPRNVANQLKIWLFCKCNLGPYQQRYQQIEILLQPRNFCRRKQETDTAARLRPCFERDGRDFQVQHTLGADDIMNACRQSSGKLMDQV